MGNLPLPERPFGGVIVELATASTPSRPEIQHPPKGAPNVIVVMHDDVGFGAASTFGGPVPTPALDRVAAQGVAYNRFHTTALCSPTRAAPLAGRNHHRAHMGGISEIASGLPLTMDGREVAGGRLERTVPFLFSMSGETLDVGVDTGSPAGPYPHRFPFTGRIHRIEIELGPALDSSHRAEEREGQARAALASQ